jgi:hypothetical protein
MIFRSWSGLRLDPNAVSFLELNSGHLRGHHSHDLAVGVVELPLPPADLPNQESNCMNGQLGVCLAHGPESQPHLLIVLAARMQPVYDLQGRTKRYPRLFRKVFLNRLNPIP